MLPAPDFYELLSKLLQQIAITPNAPRVVPLTRWPVGSQEQRLLADLQAAITALQSTSIRSEAEHLLQQQMEARLREQATLLEISQILASALELEPVLILEQLQVIIPYTHAVLFAVEGLDLVALAVRLSPQVEEDRQFRIRLTGPETLKALLNGHRPQRIADIGSDDPAAQFLRSLLTGQTAVLLQGVRAWMWVPLVVYGRIIGGIGIAHRTPAYFTPHHADLALTIANQAAIAMVNSELREQAQTVAVLEERQRLAQYLHDAINQSLFSAGLIAEVLPRLWEKDPDEARQSLQDLRQLTHGALAEMRGLLAELRPPVLTDSELSDLLHQLGSALTGRTNIPVAVTVVEPEAPAKSLALPADVQVAFYRLCQEALSNVAKHSEASQVTIHLQMAADAVELTIGDNGRGFDPEQTPSGHYGLSIMRERAQGVGALLFITSQPGHGTKITVRWTNSPE